MRLQQKIWLGAGAVIALIMLADLVLGYWHIERELRRELAADARVVRGILMATRRVYHEQFLASGLPVDEKTVGFLPAHALARISEQFPKWVDTGLRFNNVSDRPRNPVNRADPHEQAAMEWFRSHPESPERLVDITAGDGREYLHFTSPIWIEPYCLTCHGDRAAAPASIRDRYADAYGYKLGDLRGVLSIRLPLDDFRAKALGHWNREFGLRAGGYAVLLLLLGFMMRRLVVRPLRELEQVAGEFGDGPSSRRVVVAGHDEVAALGQAFNGMADRLAAHAAQIAKLNRVYAALSETNQTIVRIDDELELLRRTCRIATEHGGQTMAWIGRRNASTGCIVVAEADGKGIDYLDGLAIPLVPVDGAPPGPTAIAWTTGQAVVVQDYANDPRTAPWHERASRHGWKSSAAFPILRGGVVHLVLNLYNREAGAFDPKVVALLAEMASDIGYALDRIDLVAAQEATRRALVASEAKYREVLQTTRDGFLLIDGADRIVEVNQAFATISGHAVETLIGQPVSSLADEGFDGPAAQELHAVRQRGGLVWESRLRCRDGRIKVVEVSASAATDPSGTVALFVRDLSMRDEAHERIQRLAHFDTLTGLPNRQRFTDLARQAMTQAARAIEPVAIAFIDVDHFKNVNDTLGHQVGDQLLVALAGRISSVLRAGDVLARAGGDEFLLLLPGADAEVASHVAERLIAACTQPVAIDGHELAATCSLGIALFPADGADFETLLRKADTATYRAKEDGRSTYRFFAPEMQALTARTLRMEAALRRALERHELALHFQPQIALADGCTVGLEALLRWQHPELGAVSPAEFIPIAESSGLIIPIGDWVLASALAQLKALRDDGLPVARVAVNLSAVQFRQPRLVERVTECVAAAGLPFECLELEITESVAMADPAAAVSILGRLHALGVRIAIDDFGTGYSSLGYLKRFPIDLLKIDQSFVRDVTTDPDDANIVRAIIRLAESLQFGTIAEGVETEDQLAFLREAGCQEIQGYLFSRPLPLPALADWLRGRMGREGSGHF